MADEIIIENSDQTDSSTNAADSEEEELDQLCEEVLEVSHQEIYEEVQYIGEPPWIGIYIINKLKDRIFYPEDGKLDLNNTNSFLCFLSKQSVFGDVKLFLIEHNFFCMAKYLLKNDPYFATIKFVLRIIINLCYINEVIDVIATSREFIRIILSYLQKSEGDQEVLTNIIILLQLAACEIQINPESEWIVRFNECKFFGGRIIFLLKSSQFRLGMEIVHLIECIQEINLPDQISFFEQLFDIDLLIPARQLFLTHVILDYNGLMFSKDEYFIETFLLFLIIRRMEVGTDKYITDRFNLVTSNFGNEKLHQKFVNDIYLVNIDKCIRLLYQIVEMLLRCLYIPKIYGGTTNYLNGLLLMILVILERAKELQLSGKTYLNMQKLKKLLNIYRLHIFRQYTCKQIGYILMNLMKKDEIFEYLANCIKRDFNMIPELCEKMKNVLIACHEIHN
ncbi:uncharacterized protein LOC114945644 [Nylanderia fulva]|uniref:uncharacterized protein LOC114945644 n=1 Tax=Nylanderia fulva TaxID=613905 RepID=UPI0010FAE663|nr:uncharacterized protein LOC114945644 [Nylanderia fulva]